MADENTQREQLRTNIDNIVELNKTINLPEICDKLGIKYRQSKKLLIELGYTPKRHPHNRGFGGVPDKVIDQIIERMYSEEDSLRSIAKGFSYSYAVIYKAIRKRAPHLLCRSAKSVAVRERMSKGKMSDLPTAEIIARYKKGESATLLGEFYNVSRNTILSRLKKAGVPLNNQSVYYTDERRKHLRKLAHDGKIGVHAQGDGAYRFTKPERQFAAWCDERNISYTRQFQIREGEHRYDFLINDTKIIVEIDGVYWHSTTKQKKIDANHELRAKADGYTVVRFTDEEIEKTRSCCFEQLNR